MSKNSFCYFCLKDVFGKSILSYIYIFIFLSLNSVWIENLLYYISFLLIYIT